MDSNFFPCVAEVLWYPHSASPLCSHAQVVVSHEVGLLDAYCQHDKDFEIEILNNPYHFPVLGLRLTALEIILTCMPLLGLVKLGCCSCFVFVGEWENM